MSTFDGYLEEFPDIQVDYFHEPPPPARRPLACFLSHSHSDHLSGLATLRAPFVYCSAATRALVLAIERRHGDVVRRPYAHLSGVLRSLPLDTPTTLELAPGRRLRVTLLDANHCPGAVMFLFESDRKAALYTGDTRCEQWFVQALGRHPSLLPYTAGLRVLDTVYLDTTFSGWGGGRGVLFQADLTIARPEPLRVSDLPTQSSGLRRLLRAVACRPPDTVFHVAAGTLGYEHVWVALAAALHSWVHVDADKLRMYASLRGVPNEGYYPGSSALVGFPLGHATHAGCLVGDDGADAARIHSCGGQREGCARIRDGPVVWIRPGEEDHDNEDTIVFAYSRHASYGECCDLLALLRPRDVWPCVVQPGRWASLTVGGLFGAYCRGETRRFDERRGEEEVKNEECVNGRGEDSQTTARTATTETATVTTTSTVVEVVEVLNEASDDDVERTTPPPVYPYFYPAPATTPAAVEADDSQASTLSAGTCATRLRAHAAAVANARGGWAPLGLVSVGSTGIDGCLDLYDIG